MTIVLVWIFLPLFAAHLTCYYPVQTPFLVILTTKDSLTHTFIHWWHKLNLTDSPLLHQVLACRTFTESLKEISTPAFMRNWDNHANWHELVDVKLKCDEKKITSIMQIKPSKHLLWWCTWSTKYFFFLFFNKSGYYVSSFHHKLHVYLFSRKSKSTQSPARSVTSPINASVIVGGINLS